MRDNRMLAVVGLAVIMVIAAIAVLVGSMLGGKGKDKNAASAPNGTSTAASQPAGSTPAGEPAGMEEGEIRELVSLFNEYYFVADPEGVRELLTADHTGEDNVYAGNGTISDVTIEVLTDVSAAKEGDTCQVKVTYLDDEAGAEPQALTLELVKQSDAWRIRSYGPAA